MDGRCERRRSGTDTADMEDHMAVEVIRGHGASVKSEPGG